MFGGAKLVPHPLSLHPYQVVRLMRMLVEITNTLEEVREGVAEELRLVLAGNADAISICGSRPLASPDLSVPAPLVRRCRESGSCS